MKAVTKIRRELE